MRKAAAAVGTRRHRPGATCSDKDQYRQRVDGAINNKIRGPQFGG
jgi:hypothetical protein